MAADFFLEKGLTRAAYFSTQFHRLQKLRLHGFASRWKAKTGNKCSSLPTKTSLKESTSNGKPSLCACPTVS